MYSVEVPMSKQVVSDLLMLLLAKLNLRFTILFSVFIISVVVSVFQLVLLSSTVLKG